MYPKTICSPFPGDCCNPLMSSMRSHHLIMDWSINCGLGVYNLACPYDHPCAAIELTIHLGSSIFCGVGFFAEKVKDKFFSNSVKKFISPAHAKEIESPAPKKQVMR